MSSVNMSASSGWRGAVSRFTFALAGSAACFSAVEIACFFSLSFVPRHILYQHRWLWEHSDDRTYARITIYSWAFVVATFLMGLIGIGATRRASLILSGANIVAYPLLIVLVVLVSQK